MDGIWKEYLLGKKNNNNNNENKRTELCWERTSA